MEFWRMYRSGQFLSYNSLYEDVTAGEGEARSLDITRTTYTVTEFVEFAHRLATAGLYAEGYTTEVSLNNSQGRHLLAGRGRMPFFDRFQAGTETIPLKQTVDRRKLEAGAMPMSLSLLIELFDVFGWNPEPNQIRNEQEAFYRHEFR